MTIIYIRKEATKEVRTYTDPHPWEAGSDYLWSDGNYGCDCNRHLFFERAAGHEPNEDCECGEEAYMLRIEDDSGKELYRDERW
jgi:hypothetical protein